MQVEAEHALRTDVSPMNFANSEMERHLLVVLDEDVFSKLNRRRRGEE